MDKTLEELIKESGIPAHAVVALPDEDEAKGGDNG